MVVLNDVQVRNGERFVIGTVDGARVKMPDAFRVRWCSAHGGSTLDAIRAFATVERTFLMPEVPNARVA